MQERPDSLGPGSFVVFRAFDALVVQFVLEAPAFFEEYVAEIFDFMHNARAFARADVQPDARARLDIHGLNETMNDELIPPHGGRERSDFAKNGGMLEPEIERNQAAQRRAANSGVQRAGESAVFAIYERLHFLNQKFRVAVGAATTEFGDVRGRIFSDTRFGVVHADDDERFDRARFDAIIRGWADVPVLPGDEGSGAIEKILAVVEIKHWEMTPRLVVIARWGVNDEIALIAKKARAKLLVFAKISGTHGALGTRRPFASTFWPGVTRSFTLRHEKGAWILGCIFMASIVRRFASRSTE